MNDHPAPVNDLDPLLLLEEFESLVAEMAHRYYDVGQLSWPMSKVNRYRELKLRLQDLVEWSGK